MFRSIFYSLTVCLLVIGCKSGSTDTPQTNDSRFSEYVSNYTDGIISRKGNISIAFTEQVIIPDDINPSELFSISPALKGSGVKSGSRAFTFSPENLKSGTSYTITIDMSAFSGIPEDLELFVFKVDVIQQDFEVDLGAIQVPDPADPDKLEFEGEIATADFTENEAVEKMINFPDGLTVKWQHTSSTKHKFAVSGLQRNEEPRTLNLPISGQPIGVSRTQELKLQVPSNQGFAVMSTKVELEGETFISVFFTDALDRNQDLSGLVSLEGVKDINPVVNGNELKLYIREKVSGSKKLEILRGIKNSSGKELGQMVTSYVAFQPEKPQIKLVGSGSILPSTNGLVLPFEAVNLKGIQVEVIQVFEENVPQFLQINEIDGSEQITRVGRQVITKSVELTGKADDLSRWNRFTLDLSTLFESERGAIYQIRIGFRPEQTNYPCDELFEPASTPTSENDWSIYDYDGFNEYGGGFSYSYPRGYNWRHRDDPCNVSYYYSDRFVTKKLLATDIGLIAKIGSNNSMKVFATDMVTAKPIAANITLLDFQLQEINSATADANGVASFTPDRRPFLVVAESNGQKSYLRLEDNESQSLSNFDVSGTRTKGNIKGYIYGERGVWRPGDNIFLSFLLEAPEGRLPSDHPVVMELIDPRGVVKDKQVLNKSVKGLYSVQTNTSSDDETGNWRTKFTVGNNTFIKEVKVETIKPNRLKVKLDFGVEEIIPATKNLPINLNAKWLTGLKAKGLKAESEMTLSTTKTFFKGLGQYDFDDDAKKYTGVPKIVFSGDLDAEGSGKLNLQLPTSPNSPGALQARFNTKVLEPGGGFSINTTGIKYLPYSSFVGINLVTSERGSRIERDQPQKINLVTVDAAGKLIDREKLEFKLYRLHWRWWWDQSSDYQTIYTSSNRADLVETQTVSTQNGKGSIDFEIESPSWGRFIAVVSDPVSGHSTSTVFYTSWYGSNDNSLGASSLQVSTDKEEYATDEKIAVTIQGSHQGQALISVENGSEVLQSFWVSTNKDLTTFELDATPDMAPNVYLHVTLLQPHGQTSNDLPIRLYGVAPISVYDPNTRLKPLIQMADELEPESPVEITVKETNGQPMAYTLAMVDEGLLDLTNFSTPNPWDHFYSKEAIGVKTWDLYNEVIGAYGGRLERLLAIGGGDGSEDENNQKEESRFKPVVQFVGPFYLEAGQSKKHTLYLPQYIGSVRTMVVAGIDGAYGNAEKATPVVKPLMVLGTLPRVVGPDEKVTMPVNVFKYKDHIKNAKITVETTGVLKLTGSKSQTIDLKDATGTLYFDMDVENRVGPAKVIITAKSGNETAKHEINIESRSPNSPQTVVKVLPLESGKTINPREKLFGMEGTNEVSLEIAAIPPINLERRLKYLMRYPHGCVEQTVSSAFPQLFLENISELSAEEKIKIQLNINAAIKRLTRFQTSGGGLGYWPGYSNTNSWGTNYAYHFLIEAQKQGYLVPNDMMDKIRNFQRNQARNWTKSNDYHNSDLIQAYRLFTLAIGGYAEIGAMNRLRNTSDLSTQTIQKLAGAYAAIGQEEAARNMMKGHGRAQMKEHPYRYYYYNYGSFTRDLAMLLETYVYMDNKAEAFKLIQELSKDLSESRWMSTQTTAYALLAVSKYVEANHSDKGLKANISYTGNSIEWESKKAINKTTIPPQAIESLKVENLGESTLFATLTVIGTPPPGKEPIQNENMSSNMIYTDTGGRRISPDTLKMGESMEIYITVKNEYNPGYIRDIALTQILPSGWEIQNDRLNDQDSGDYDSYDYRDIRDDRIYTYFDLGGNDKKTFMMTVTAAYPGKYYLPGAYAEAMYNASISSKNPGKWVYVVKE
ncbi:MAG: MG2 domain-containing protein [Marinoscillum sp.]